MPVTRINFIEREPLAITYRKMAIIGVVVVGLCLLTIAGQWGRKAFLQHRVGRLTTEINELRAEREKILKASQSEAGGMAANRMQLRTPFEKTPSWSLLLRSLGQSMPSTVWLASLRTYDKPESPSGKGIILIGETQTAREVSSFLKGLSADRNFQNVVLSSSKEEKGAGGSVRYHFTVEAFVAPGGAL